MDTMKVLIAENNTSVSQFIRYTLQEHFPKFEFEVATNGKNIQKRIEETRYDLIIYAREMPMLSGDEFLLWRQDHARLSAVPVVIMSADRREECLKTAVKLGANAYLIKPLLMEHLVSSIREIIGTPQQDPRDRRKSARIKAEGKICLKFEGNTCRGELINVSSGGILGMFNRKDGLPRILDHVQVDIELNNRPELHGLTADVIRIQAVDSFRGLEYIQLVVRFDDTLHPEKKKEFEHIISNFQPGTLTK
jgi:two-component system chemotaxis response regulator CheY